jgi:hypothetical protein
MAMDQSKFTRFSCIMAFWNGENVPNNLELEKLHYWLLWNNLLPAESKFLK